MESKADSTKEEGEISDDDDDILVLPVSTRSSRVEQPGFGSGTSMTRSSHRSANNQNLDNSRKHSSIKSSQHSNTKPAIEAKSKRTRTRRRTSSTNKKIETSKQMGHPSVSDDKKLFDQLPQIPSLLAIDVVAPALSTTSILRTLSPPPPPPPLPDLPPPDSPEPPPLHLPDLPPPPPQSVKHTQKPAVKQPVKPRPRRVRNVREPIKKMSPPVGDIEDPDYIDLLLEYQEIKKQLDHINKVENFESREFFGDSKIEAGQGEGPCEDPDDPSLIDLTNEEEEDLLELRLNALKSVTYDLTKQPTATTRRDRAKRVSPQRRRLPFAPRDHRPMRPPPQPRRRRFDSENRSSGSSSVSFERSGQYHWDVPLRRDPARRRAETRVESLQRRSESRWRNTESRREQQRHSEEMQEDERRKREQSEQLEQYEQNQRRLEVQKILTLDDPKEQFKRFMELVAGVEQGPDEGPAAGETPASDNYEQVEMDLDSDAEGNTDIQTAETGESLFSHSPHDPGQIPGLDLSPEKPQVPVIPEQLGIFGAPQYYDHHYEPVYKTDLVPVPLTLTNYGTAFSNSFAELYSSETQTVLHNTNYAAQNLQNATNNQNCDLTSNELPENDLDYDNLIPGLGWSNEPSKPVLPVESNDKSIANSAAPMQENEHDSSSHSLDVSTEEAKVVDDDSEDEEAMLRAKLLKSLMMRKKLQAEAASSGASSPRETIDKAPPEPPLRKPDISDEVITPDDRSQSTLSDKEDNEKALSNTETSGSHTPPPKPKNYYKVPQQMPLLIRIGQESDSEDEQATSPSEKPKAEGAVDAFIGNLDSFIREARQTVECQQAAERAAAHATQDTLKTPESLRHLPQEKIAEYKALKERLRQTEENESKEREAKEKVVAAGKQKVKFIQLELLQQRHHLSVNQENLNIIKREIQKKKSILRMGEEHVQKLKEQLAAATKIVQSNRGQLEGFNIQAQDAQAHVDERKARVQALEAALYSVGRQAYGENFKPTDTDLFGSKAVSSGEENNKPQDKHLQVTISKSTKKPRQVVVPASIVKEASSPIRKVIVCHQEESEDSDPKPSIERKVQIIDKFKNNIPKNTVSQEKQVVPKSAKNIKAIAQEKARLMMLEKKYAEMIRKHKEAQNQKTSIVQNEKTSLVQNKKTIQNKKTSIVQNKKTSIVQNKKASTVLPKTKPKIITKNNSSAKTQTSGLKSPSVDGVWKTLRKKSGSHSRRDSVMEHVLTEEVMTVDTREEDPLPSGPTKSVIDMSPSMKPRIQGSDGKIDFLEPGDDSEKLTVNKSSPSGKSDDKFLTIPRLDILRKAQRSYKSRLQSHFDEVTNSQISVTSDILQCIPTSITKMSGAISLKLHGSDSVRDPVSHQGLPTYHSSLANFRAYRLSPYFRTRARYSLSSQSFSHKIDPMKIMCPFDLMGKCNDKSCKHQHIDSYSLTSEELLKDLASYCPQLVAPDSAALNECLANNKEEYSRDLNKFVSSFQKTNSKITPDQQRLLLVGKVNETGKRVPPHTMVMDVRPWQPKQICDMSTDISSEESSSSSEKSALKSNLSDDEDLDIRYWNGHSTGVEALEASVLSNPTNSSNWIRLAQYKLHHQDNSGDKCLDLALNILARGLESNRGCSRLWQHYLTLYSQRANHSDIINLCKQAVQYAPSYCLFNKYITLCQTFATKVSVCDKAITYLLSADCTETSSERSHHLLELVIHQGALHIQAGRVTTTIRDIVDFREDGAVPLIIWEYLTPLDRLILYLTHISLCLFHTVPTVLFDPSWKHPGRIVYKKPFILPWAMYFDKKSGSGNKSVVELSERALDLLEKGIVLLNPEGREDKSTSVDEVEEVYCLHFNIAEMFKAAGRIEQSMDVLSRYLAEVQDIADIFLKLIECAIAAGTETETVQKLYTEAFQFVKTDPRLYLAAADFELSQGNDDDSLVLMENCILSFYEPNFTDSSSCDPNLLFCKLLDQPVPLGFSPTARSSISKEHINKYKAHLWICYCLLLDLQGCQDHVPDIYEVAISSVDDPDMLLLLWLRYLSYEYGLLVKMNDKQRSEASRRFGYLVKRCMQTLPTRRPLPLTADEHWTDYSLHNSVIDFLLKILPLDVHLSAYEDWIPSQQTNIALLLRAVKHMEGQGHTALARGYCVEALQDTPTSLSLWNIYISLLQEDNQSRETRKAYRQATKYHPLNRQLWKDFVLFELIQKSTEGIKYIKDRCKDPAINIETWIRTWTR